MRDNLFVRTLRNRFVPIVMVALLFGIAMICYDVMWVRPVYSVDSKVVVSAKSGNTSTTQIKKGTTHKLETTHHLHYYPNQKPLLFIGLVEIDDNVNPNQLVEVFKNNLLKKHVKGVSATWEKSVKTASESNDNLGIVFQRPSTGIHTYLIAGNQLTDRYEYRFNVDIK